MGGKNHQPCNQPGTNYLLHSTRMSRALSKARIEVEQANVALEDILIAEIDVEARNLPTTPILEHLDQSSQTFLDFISCVAALRENMGEHRYEDLPIPAGVDLTEISECFVEAGMVDANAWKFVCETMGSGGFFGILDHFTSGAEELRKLIHELRMRVWRLPRMTGDHGQIALLLEKNNEPSNIKIEFARVYTTLGNFEAVFLASSILSTELWYANEGHPLLFNRATLLVSRMHRPIRHAS